MACVITHAQRSCRLQRQFRVRRGRRSSRAAARWLYEDPARAAFNYFAWRAANAAGRGRAAKQDRASRCARLVNAADDRTKPHYAAAIAEGWPVPWPPVAAAGRGRRGRCRIGELEIGVSRRWPGARATAAGSRPGSTAKEEPLTKAWAQIAAGVGPFIPDRNATVLEIFDVEVAQ